jgi:hypothetical protein
VHVGNLAHLASIMLLVKAWGVARHAGDPRVLLDAWRSAYRPTRHWRQAGFRKQL